MARKSIALHYYVSAAERELPRGTEWLETETLPFAARLRAGLKTAVREATPPFAYKLVRKARFALGRG